MSTCGIAIRRLLVGLALLATVGLLPAEASAATHLAWVQVAVATVWGEPSSPQRIDRPALENPARIEGWLGSLTVTDRLALDSRIDTQILLGNEVVVLGRRRGWSEIEIPDQRDPGQRYGIVGWVPSVQLSPVAPPVGEPHEIVGVPRAWLYSFDDSHIGRRLFLVSYDTVLPVLAAIPGYLVVGLPGGSEGALAAGTLDPIHDGTVSGVAIALQARQFLGLPYLWGGTSSFGYDCSGLVYALYARYGIYLPRDAAGQQHAGRPVSLDKLQPGDLLFFGRPAFHVAIYVGRGRVIDSPYSGASVEIVPMTSIPVWKTFSGAIRVSGVASN